MKKLEKTKRETYASDFVTAYTEQFLSIMDNPRKDQFTITRKEWGQFLLDCGYLPPEWDTLPPKDSDRWHKYLHTINTIRREMNEAAKLGLHGEPPFEAVAQRHSGDVTVRSLRRMALVTHKDVADALSMYIGNKAADVRKMHYFLMKDENASRLTEGLRSRLKGAEMVFNQTIKVATVSLDSYLSAAQEVASEAMQLLESKQ